MNKAQAYYIPKYKVLIAMMWIIGLAIDPIICAEIFKSIKIGEFSQINETSNAVEKEAIEWIHSNWHNVDEVVFSEIERQAQLRNDNLLIKHIQEMMVFVDKSEQKWDGRWAVVLTGRDKIFGAKFSYYVELNRKTIVVSSASGIGFQLAGIFLEKRNEAIFVKELSMDKSQERLISQHDSMLLQGIWTLSNDTNKEDFQKCFGLDLGSCKLNDASLVYLDIDNDLSCKIVMPFTGVTQNFWRGKVYGFEVAELPKAKFMVIDEIKPNFRKIKSGDLRFVSLDTAGSLNIRRENLCFRFTRPIATPLVDYSESSNVIRKLASGVFQIK